MLLQHLCLSIREKVVEKRIAYSETRGCLTSHLTSTRHPRTLVAVFCDPRGRIELAKYFRNVFSPCEISILLAARKMPGRVNPTSCTFVGKETKRSSVNANREIEFRAPLRVRHYRLLIKFAPFSSTPSLLIFWRARASLLCESRSSLACSSHELQLVNRSLSPTRVGSIPEHVARPKKNEGTAERNLFCNIDFRFSAREPAPLAFELYRVFRGRSVVRYYQTSVPLSF